MLPNPKQLSLCITASSQSITKLGFAAGIPPELLSTSACTPWCWHTRAGVAGEPGDPFPRRIAAIKTQPAPVYHLLLCLIRCRND